MITDEALLSPQRIDYITNYILEHFDTQTMRNAKAYTLNGKRLRGFMLSLLLNLSLWLCSIQRVSSKAK
ncbi:MULTISPECIES: hypothetical protein [Helicobacter]|uniref:hypothetical protein n=1 Tax=Helicobacter TaxID=209 RepID=UPI000685EEFC|nr:MULTISPECIES: hypothetical protein [Helicobacter]